MLFNITGNAGVVTAENENEKIYLVQGSIDVGNKPDNISDEEYEILKQAMRAYHDVEKEK